MHNDPTTPPTSEGDEHTPRDPPTEQPTTTHHDPPEVHMI